MTPHHGYRPETKRLTPPFRMAQGDSPELRDIPPLKEGHKREIAPTLAMALFVDGNSTRSPESFPSPSFSNGTAGP